MLLATLPSKYASVFNVDWAGTGEVWPDGQAKYVPQRLRLLGRRLFGKAIKYPLLRPGHFPEWILKHKLYLNFTGKHKPRFRVPLCAHPGARHAADPPRRVSFVPRDFPSSINLRAILG